MPCLSILLLSQLALPAAPAVAGADSLRESLRFEVDLQREIRKALLSNSAGAALASSLKKPGELPSVFFSDLEQLDGIVNKDWDAMYFRDSIYLKKSKVLRYFGAEGRPEESVDWAKLRKDRARMKRAAGEMALGYFHEMVHFRQYEALSPEDLPIAESEYEAFLRTSIYFLDEVSRKPSLLARNAAEPAFANRTKSSFASAAANDLFLICLGKKGYIAHLDSVYRGAVTREDGPIDGDDPQRKAFTLSVEKLMDEAWPGLWLEAALSGGKAALAAGSYPRALRCLVPEAGEPASYGLPGQKLAEVASEGEKALAASLAALRAGDKGDFETYSYLFRSVEDAHSRLRRGLPADIAAMRPGLYAKARKFYAAKAAVEKSAAWRAYLLNQQNYFSRD